MSCPKGGFLSIRHNDIRDLTANLLPEVCNNVCIEPDLQPINGEVLPNSSNTQDGVRLDIAANGFGVVGLSAPSSISDFLILMPPPTDIPVAQKARAREEASV